jgi:pyruvate/2-oxoglutarate dehydrogenase complex dihydrolipoamide acyltransferase (E2) component
VTGPAVTVMAAAVRAPLAGTVVSVAVAPGHLVAAGDELLVIEAMKMEHEVRAQAAGVVREVPVAAGATVPAGAVLVVLAGSGDEAAGPARGDDIPLDHVRPDLEEVRERHRAGLDEGRPEVTGRRHAAGRRTARENVADLVDPGSFTEYGALTIAAQRRRRPLGDLIARTPADGLVAGTATVGGRPVAVMSSTRPASWWGPRRSGRRSCGGSARCSWPAPGSPCRSAWWCCARRTAWARWR